ncbi:MAG: hypothetical protein WCL21_11775 [Mariniphaga sp.]
MGKITVQASFVGFKTNTVDFEALPGQNDLNFTFDKEDIQLEAVTVILCKNKSYQKLKDGTIKGI